MQNLRLSDICCKVVEIYLIFFTFQDEIKTLTIDMVKKFGKHRYIANLGHGITPQTPIESMTVFTESVHEAV